VIGCIQTLNKKRGEMFDEKDTHYLMLLSDHISIAIQNARGFEETKQKMQLERELNHAAEIQRQFLPKENLEIPQYEIFVYHQPSKLVGGDYYDYFRFPQSVSFAVADVSGKGVPAAMLTSHLHASLHAVVNENIPCAEIVKKLNNHFHLHTSSNKFATFFWAKLNYQDHSLKFVNAGHMPPLLIKREGAAVELKGGGLPIGIMSDFDYSEQELSLSAGDAVVVYSDGITEASNSNGDRFCRERFLDFLQRRRHLSAWVLGNGLVNELTRFAGSNQFEDDVTLSILKKRD
jgi:sigma-B regulation protein RsbU (phosphoserine phosphatase)